MTQSENENDHFDLDHFDHILGKGTYNALWYWVVALGFPSAADLFDVQGACRHV